MHVVRGWRQGVEIDERAAKESEMIWMGVGEDESGSVSRCSRQLKIACNSTKLFLLSFCMIMMNHEGRFLQLIYRRAKVLLTEQSKITQVSRKGIKAFIFIF